MNPPKKNRGILLLFVGLAGIFLLCVIILSAKQVENHKTIQSLRKNVATLNHRILAHQDAMARTDFYRFQENIYRLQTPEFSRITAAAFTKGRKHGFDPYLVMAIIFVESRFNRRAVSRAGAYGLMQVNYPVWKNELNIDRRKLAQVDYNIDLGLTILKGYLRETKCDMIKALILYNNGYKYSNSNYSEKIIASNFYRHAGIS
jgi:soluble lytic murein transglycosylase-like protein